MRFAARVLAAIAACTFATGVEAQKTPLVAVKFTVREPSYRTEYGASLAQIERAFGKFLAARLAEQMAYVHFDTVMTAPRTLVFALDRRDPGSSTPRHEIGLYVRLLNGTTSSAEQYWVMFRPIDQFLARRGTPDQLLNELRVRFSAGDLDALQAVLRDVPVAAQAQLWRDPVLLAWILPFKRRDLCMDGETTLLVRSMIQSAAGPLEYKYVASANGEFRPAAAPPPALRDQVGNVLMGPLTSQSGDLAALRSATVSAITVGGVFVDHYRRSDSVCATPAAPDSIAYTAGQP